MVLNDQDLHKLHVVCLELIKEVDRICRLHHIEYTLDGGTLLGAVREKGFISWDDDADIAMTRTEYKKFFKACKKSLNKDRFFLQDYKTDKHYPWGYSKLRMNGTRLVRADQGHLKFHDGIYIDIFVYDPVPDNFITRRLHYFACFCVRKCQYSVVGKIYSKNQFLRLWYAILDKIPKKLVFRCLEKLVRITYKKKTILASHKTFPYPRKACKYGLPAKCFEEYMDIAFEGHSFRCMKSYDIYLRMLYGDYMTPPEMTGEMDYPIGLLDFGDN